MWLFLTIRLIKGLFCNHPHKSSPEKGGRGKKEKKMRIAHLYWSEDDHGISVVRMTNPIVHGHPMGYGWYDIPHETVFSPQEYSNKIREVVFYTDSYGKSGYAYPEETI